MEIQTRSIKHKLGNLSIFFSQNSKKNLKFISQPCKIVFQTPTPSASHLNFYKYANTSNLNEFQWILKQSLVPSTWHRFFEYFRFEYILPTSCHSTNFFHLFILIIVIAHSFSLCLRFHCVFFRLDFRFSFRSWDNQQNRFLGIETTRQCFNYGARKGGCVCEVRSHLTVKDYNRERSYFERLKEFAKCFVNIWMFTYDNFSSFSIFFEMKNVLCASENLFGSDELNRVSRILEKASSRSSMAAGRLEEVSFSLARQKRVCVSPRNPRQGTKSKCVYSWFWRKKPRKHHSPNIFCAVQLGDAVIKQIQCVFFLHSRFNLKMEKFGGSVARSAPTFGIRHFTAPVINHRRRSLHFSSAFVETRVGWP